MKLDISQIKSITCGAVEIVQQHDGFHFHRFTREQEELYKERRADFYEKAFATSGITFRFRTNSRRLSITTVVSPGSSRRYFAFDIFVNGKRLGSLKNFDDHKMHGNYTAAELPLGKFSGSWDLGTGEKEVRVLFPWSVAAVIEQVELDDGATIVPVKPGKKILCYGDSITQGYDALSPANKYITRVADLLKAEEFNKAIGGEKFWPTMAATQEPIAPDYVWVAYGTNDWSKIPKEQLIENCVGFYDHICRKYPDIPVYAIAPIWRKYNHKDWEFYDLWEIAEVIRSAVKPYENVIFLSAYDYVPKDEAYFADLSLHPNEKGFDEYYKNLAANIRP